MSQDSEQKREDIRDKESRWRPLKKEEGFTSNSMTLPRGRLRSNSRTICVLNARILFASKGM